MGFLKKLLGGDRAPQDDGVYFYVRCDSCGEAIRVRMNPGSDLDPVFEGSGDDPSSYEFRKEILGSRCFKLIYGVWRFDKGRRLTGGEVQGATEITADEYAAQTSAPA
jgi:hypothetical protein